MTRDTQSWRCQSFKKIRVRLVLFIWGAGLLWTAQRRLANVKTNYFSGMTSTMATTRSFTNRTTNGTTDELLSHNNNVTTPTTNRTAAVLLSHNDNVTTITNEQEAARRRRYFAVSAKFGRDDAFATAMAQYRAMVASYGIFAPANVHTYSTFPDYIVQHRNTTWASHLQFLRDPQHASQRGGGYWFWKPVLLQHYLSQKMKDGDVLVYSDADMLNHWNWTRQLMDRIAEGPAVLGLYGKNAWNLIYTKCDTFQALCPRGPDPHNHSSAATPLSQYGANMIFIRKTAVTVQLLDAWADAVSNYTLVSDIPSRAPNVPGFRDHRHDQSIFNCLLNCQFNVTRRTLFPRLRLTKRQNRDYGNPASWRSSVFMLELERVGNV